MNNGAIDKAAAELYSAMYSGNPPVKYGALASAHKLYWQRVAWNVVKVFLVADDGWDEFKQDHKDFAEAFKASPGYVANADKDERHARQDEMQKLNIKKKDGH
jgi:hypothetical protein